MTGTIRQIGKVEREIVSEQEWRSGRQDILAREKALTRAHDELAAERRRQPWMKVDKDYRFTGPSGELTLGDLFDNRHQLVVYHHMLKPADPSPCSGCGMVGDQIPHLAHLHQRDTSLVFVSRAPIGEIEAFRKRIGWNIPWYSTTDDFDADFDVKGGFGLNIFYKDGRDIYRTYFTTGRGVEMLGTIWAFLDLTPLGRQETWEKAPAGTPQTEPYGWWRLHDEYEAG
jgi:predicted dithiol-disulfide oxidoreductase (DUF899 family)